MKHYPTSISIFISPVNILGNNQVLTIISDLVKIDIVEQFTIELKSTSSGGLQLNLFTKKEYLDRLLARSKEMIDNYLGNLQDKTLGSNSKIPFRKTKLRAFFKYAITTKIKKGRTRQEIFLLMQLSKITLVVLQDAQWDKETLTSFAFYIQMGWLKTALNINPEIIHQLKAFCHGALHQNNIQENTESKNSFNSAELRKDVIYGNLKNTNDRLLSELRLNSNFEAQRPLLMEITRDVMNNTQSDLPIWMENWFESCKAEINQHRTFSFSRYQKIFNLLFKYLGLKRDFRSLLSYFIQRASGIMSRPDIIIMGAQKSGTSALHYTLIKHPDIQGPVNPINFSHIKEVNFFCHPPNWEMGINWYLSHFSGEKSTYIESSPNYLSSPFCLKRMQMVVPNSKLIICLRDPVYRAYSQYNHYKQTKPRSDYWDWNADLNFADNISSELENAKKYLEDISIENDSETSFDGLILRGVYINQIRLLLNYYDRSQIYITIMDKWNEDAENEISNILKFIGVDNHQLKLQISNRREYTVEPFGPETKLMLKQFYEPYNKKLFDFLGYEIKEWT